MSFAILNSLVGVVPYFLGLRFFVFYFFSFFCTSMNKPNVCSTYGVIISLSDFSLAILMLLSVSESVHLCEIFAVIVQPCWFTDCKRHASQWGHTLAMPITLYTMNNEEFTKWNCWDNNISTNWSSFVLYYVFWFNVILIAFFLHSIPFHGHFLSSIFHVITPLPTHYTYLLTCETTLASKLE